MTDARAECYDESYPALDGLSGNTSNRVGSTNTSLSNNNNNLNNNNAANSWSAHTASGHRQQNKLNYIQQIHDLYQQQHHHQQQNTTTNPSQQQQQQQQQQQKQQQLQTQPQESSQHQEQVLNHLVENNTSIVAAQHHTLQQSHKQESEPQFSASNIRPSVNANMQNSNFQQAPQQQQHQQHQPQPQQQQQPKRPGAPNHPMLSERVCTFKITPEERRHRDFEAEQSRILKEIMQKTSTKIEVTTTKDGALNFCIIGKEYNLATAKNLVLNDFQTAVTLTVSVPKAVHGRLLGPKGQRLAAIQDETQTKITIPRKDEDSDVIKIVGLKNNAELAVRAIEKCAREFAGKVNERVTVERNYLLFITGPFNENLKRWEEMGAKVSTSGGLLPSNNERESGHADEVTFTIIGEVNAVNQVKEEITRIYEDKKKKCTTVNIEVKKAQHKYILGPAGQNLRQLFAKTGVSVELPHESESETITLRGERSKLATALSELYTQAHSETDDYFEVETWLHKYLIGPKKSNFKSLGVDVKSLDDKIRLHGPPAAIDEIMDSFETDLVQLRKTLIQKDIRIEPRIHGFIIGRSGATVDQIREESGANVIVPKNDESSELITLEGTHEAVAIAEEKINAIAKRYEASRKLVIDQQLHGSIIGRGGEKIRSIREKFSQVIFSFPEMGSRHNEITIVGPAEEVDECHKYLDELHLQIQENNHQIQVPIKKDVLKYLSDAKQAIKRLKLEHQVKIELFVNENSATNQSTSSAVEQQKNKSKEDKEEKSGENKKQSGDSKKKNDSNKADGKGNKNANKQNGVPDNKQTEQRQKANDASTEVAKKPNLDNYAVIIGKKENAEVAKQKLVKLLDEFATTIEIEMKISPNMRELLGPKTKIYRQFCEEFQNKVTVLFPPMQKQQSSNKQQASGDDQQVAGENTNGTATGNKAKNKGGNRATGGNKEQQPGDNNNNASTEVVKIRCPKSIAKKAEKRFEGLIAECHKNFTVKFNIDASVYDKFVYTDKLKLKTIRDTLSVKLHIPDKREGVNRLVCTIVGYEKDVYEAQKQFDTLMKDVAERVEETIEISSQVHPRLIGAQGRAVKKLMDDYKIAVKFARPGDPNPNAVTLLGRQQNINAAKAHMQKVANQFLNMVNRNGPPQTNMASNADGTNSANEESGEMNNDDNSQQKLQQQQQQQAMAAE